MTKEEIDADLKRRKEKASRDIEVILKREQLGIELQMIYAIDGIRPGLKLADLKKYETAQEETSTKLATRPRRPKTRR